MKVHLIKFANGRYAKNVQRIYKILWNTTADGYLNMCDNIDEAKHYKSRSTAKNHIKKLLHTVEGDIKYYTSVNTNASHYAQRITFIKKAQFLLNGATIEAVEVEEPNIAETAKRIRFNKYMEKKIHRGESFHTDNRRGGTCGLCGLKLTAKLNSPFYAIESLRIAFCPACCKRVSEGMQNVVDETNKQDPNLIDAIDSEKYLLIL